MTEATHIPTLATERLLLRPFTLADAPAVEALVSAREIAATTLSIPHPYPAGAAETWIRSSRAGAESGLRADFAVTLRGEGTLCGAVGLVLDAAHDHAELGYWIGVPWWGRGFASEAARAVVRYAFEARDVHRVYAHCFAENEASGKVLANAGMRFEGRLRGHIRKWGRFVDVLHYGMLRSDFDRATAGDRGGAGAPDPDAR